MVSAVRPVRDEVARRRPHWHLALGRPVPAKSAPSPSRAAPHMRLRAMAKRTWWFTSSPLQQFGLAAVLAVGGYFPPGSQPRTFPSPPTPDQPELLSRTIPRAIDSSSAPAGPFRRPGKHQTLFMGGSGGGGRERPVGCVAWRGLVAIGRSVPLGVADVSDQPLAADDEPRASCDALRQAIRAAAPS